MIKLFYAVGDSFVFGQEMGPPITKDTFHQFDIYKRVHCYSGIMADTLKIPAYKNSGSPAGSNERSYRVLINDITEKLTIYAPEEIFVNVGLTSATRREFCLNDAGAYYLHMYTWEPPEKDNKVCNDLWKVLDKDFNHDYGNQMFDMMMILSIQNFLRINKIPYLISSALHIPQKLRSNEPQHIPEYLINQIYEKRFFVVPSFNRFADNFKRGPESHPLEEGHAAWATHLLNYINQNNLLDNSDL